MSISHRSPTGEKETDSRFVAGCQSFQKADYYQAAKWFKRAYERNRDKKWFLVNYATSIRNAGYIDFSLRILKWLLEKYPDFYFLKEINKKTLNAERAISLYSQNSNPCYLLGVKHFELQQGYPPPEYVVDEDFHDISISLCMIVKNEAKHIANAIKSVKPIIDEIIVADTGSTDDTPEIARSLGAKIFDYEWKNNFSEARNYSLQHATKDWILILDGDETISYCDLFTIKEHIVIEKDYWGFAFTQRDYFDQKIMGAVSCEDDYYEESQSYVCYKSQQICRLIKNSDKVHFSYPVYEIAEESIKLNGGEFVYTNIPIHHYGRLVDRKTAIEKRKYYISILEKHIKSPEEPDRLKAIYCSNIARAYAFIEEYIIAYKYLEKANEYEPNSHYIYFDLGTNAILRKKYSEAIKWFEKAIGLNGRFSEYYLGIAQAYTFTGNIARAQETLDKCLQIDPNNAFALQFKSQISKSVTF